MGVFKHTVRPFVDPSLLTGLLVIVGVIGVGFTVTASVVTDSLTQPDAFTHTNVNTVVPVTDVVMVNDAKLVGVTVELVPPPTATVEPSVPVVPEVEPGPVPPIELLPVGVVVAEEITQFVSTVSEGAPWQIATAPEPPPAIARLAGVPLTAVKLARFGRGLTVSVNDVAVLEQGAALLQITL